MKKIRRIVVLLLFLGCVFATNRVVSAKEIEKILIEYNCHLDGKQVSIRVLENGTVVAEGCEDIKVDTNVHTTETTEETLEVLKNQVVNRYFFSVLRVKKDVQVTNSNPIMADLDDSLRVPFCGMSGGLFRYGERECLYAGPSSAGQAMPDPKDDNYIYYIIEFSFHENENEYKMVDDKINAILAGTEGDSELEKVRYIYNYMCENLPEERSSNTGYPRNCNGVYGALFGDGTGFCCSTYTNTLLHFFKNAGLEAYGVAGAYEKGEICHSYVFVKVNKKWYKLDYTTRTNNSYLLEGLDSCKNDQLYQIYGTELDVATQSISKTDMDVPAEQMITSFVERMYTVALGRDSDIAGIEDWTNRLLTKQIDGAGIAIGFIDSDEFVNRNLSNSDYVDVLYATFFDRKADEEGKNNWLSALTDGRTRDYVLAGFVNSEEFGILAGKFGIERGSMNGDYAQQNDNLGQYVKRLYLKALNRNYDQRGFEDWKNAIASKEKTAIEVAKTFFYSEEFNNRHLNNSDYVETLYETFMGRSSDEAGKADWVGILDSNRMSRGQVLDGFAESQEFHNIVQEFQLE